MCKYDQHAHEFSYTLCQVPAPIVSLSLTDASCCTTDIEAKPCLHLLALPEL